MKIPSHPEEGQDMRRGQTFQQVAQRSARREADTVVMNEGQEAQLNDSPLVALCKDIIICPFSKPLKTWCPAAIQNVSTIKTLTSFL